MNPDVLLSPDQVAANEARDKEQMEENRTWLLDMASRLGFTINKLEKDEEGYVIEPEEDGDSGMTLEHTKGWRGTHYETYSLQATRPDGKTVKARVIVRPINSSYAFPVDIEADAFFDHHGGNHDMQRGELEMNLKQALERPEYPEHKDNK
ncbi:MAG: hypothetical protein WCX71_04730 [Candidatus Buchananbacteria bacterium]